METHVPSLKELPLWDPANPAGYANRSGAYKTRVQSEFVREHFPPAPARVFDLAGGSGRFALPLLRDGYHVTVNDINSSCLRFLQQRCADLPVSLLPGDFLQVNVPGQFDCALAMECLHFMPFEQALSRVRDLLKPGGVFVFSQLNSGSWRFWARRMLGRTRGRPREHVMNRRGYCAACDKLGFDVLTMRGLMWTPFTVNSNSPLVPVFGNLERALGLSAIHSQSPWLLIAIRRRM